MEYSGPNNVPTNVKSEVEAEKKKTVNDDNNIDIYSPFSKSPLFESWDDLSTIDERKETFSFEWSNYAFFHFF